MADLINPYLWAKKKESNGAWLWLPLYQHLEDTKHVIAYLWEHWLSEGQRALINQGSAHRGKDIAIFLACTHDLGKATPVFQKTQSFQQSDHGLDETLLSRLEQAGFEGLSTAVLQSAKCTKHAYAGQYLLHTFDVPEALSTIVGGHHGKTVDQKSDYEKQVAYKSNYFQCEDDHSLIGEKWHHQHKNILAFALAESGFENVEALPEISQPAQVLLLGLLIMADWIASNERYFPLIEIEQRNVEDDEQRYQTGLQLWARSQRWAPAYLYDSTEAYQKRFSFDQENLFQEKVFQLIQGADDSNIFIIEAPMGIGKTEAALISAEQLAFSLGANGLFFGLPTQATSNGIFSRILAWLKALEKDEDDRLSLRLAHGKAALNKDFYDLAHGINEDDTENGQIIVNEWFSGKKTSSLDDFVVGTVDQFLLLALKQKHLALRHLGFSRKVVIIDEVHAYDAYMNQYLTEALTWMGAYHIPVIILSATLPHARRFELIKSYLKGKGVSKKGKEWVALSEELKTDAYPLVTYNDGDEIRQWTDFEHEHHKEIKIIKKAVGTIDDIIEALVNSTGNIGIVVNTVKTAQTLAKKYAAMYGQEHILLLHSGFIDTDRAAKEEALLAMIGKKAQRPDKKIIIGTQVIEQSLDIDFDVMISELAPMDLLIQRMGRLHRHPIRRPAAHKQPTFYVVGCDENFDFDSGSEAVYGGYLLARTQYYLPDKITIPQNISPLVQKVYDFKLTSEKLTEQQAMDLDEPLQQRLLEFQKAYAGLIKHKEIKAEAFKLKDPVLKKSKVHEANLIGWQQNKFENETEERSFAQVRDIRDTIEVIALKKYGDGYGTFHEEKDVSRDIHDFRVAKELAKHTLRLPGVFSYGIDKHIKTLEEYNLRTLPEWQHTVWLKGALGIIFDEHDCFKELDGIELEYSREYGIAIVKEDADESV